MIPAPSRVDTGVQLGPYLLEHRLTTSRASALYVARDKAGTRVVVRLVHAEAATRGVRTRLKREARALAGVDHSGVVRVHRVGEFEGLPWVSMGYVRGTDLRRAMAERGTLTFDEATRFAIQIAEALAVAHEVGVVHRQLKPSNVILVPDGHVVVVDFGIVPHTLDVPEGRDGVTTTDTAEAGSAYASPEQLEHGLADERSDVWAVGCLLYEMLTGEPPFGRGGAATVQSILSDEPLFPSQTNSTAVHIVNACLRKNSFARVATARELLVLLRDAFGEPRRDAGLTTDRASPWAAGSVVPRASEPSSHRSRGLAGDDSTVRPVAPSGTIPPPPRLPSMTFVASSPRVSEATLSRPASGVARTAATRGRIKGTVLRAGIAWFGEMFGRHGMARVIDLATPELKGILRSKDPVFGLIASGWYDTQLVGELIELIERVASPSDRAAFGSSVGEAIARDNVSGVHKALFRLVSSPQLLETNAQRMWRTYVDEGTLSVGFLDAGSFEACVRGWSRHHPSVCRTIRAMLESSLRAVGYSGLVLERTQCVGLGDLQCAFDGRWRA